MRELDDASVSLIVADPPYFTDGLDDGWDRKKIKAQMRGGTVASMPGGMRFDPAQGKRLYSFMLPVAGEWIRILRPGAFALCFAAPRLSHRTASAMDDAGLEIRDLLGWLRGGQAKAFSQDHFIRRRPIPESEKEDIVKSMAGRKTPQLRPAMEAIVLGQKPREGTFADNWMKWRVGLINTSPAHPEEGFPSALLKYPNEGRREGHLTAKPVRLLRRLIRIFGAGDAGLVLDPFCGSGSTGEAALAEGYPFLGFEMDVEMARRANRRILAGTREGD